MGEQLTNTSALRALVFINQSAVELYNMWSTEPDNLRRREYQQAANKLRDIATMLKARLKTA